MLPLAIGALAGAGLGAIKHNQDKGEFNRKKELAARLAQWSPWTGINAAQFMPGEDPNLLSSVMQGAIGGAAQGQGVSSWAQQQEMQPLLMEQLQTQNKLNKAYLDNPTLYSAYMRRG